MFASGAVRSEGRSTEESADQDAEESYTTSGGVRRLPKPGEATTATHRRRAVNLNAL